MYTSRIKMGFEVSPIEVFRRYGPAFIAIFAGLAIVVLIYEYVHGGSKEILDSTQSSVTGIIETSKDETTSIIKSFHS